MGHLFGWWLKVRTVTLLRWICCRSSLWLVAQGSYRYITPMALLWAISLVGGSRFVPLHYSDGFVVGHLFGWWLKVRIVTLLRWLCCGPSLWLVAQGSYSYITPMALWLVISLVGGSRFVPLHYSDGFVVGHLFGWWLKVRTVTLLRWLCCWPSLWLVAQGSYSYFTPMALLSVISLVGGSRFVQLHYSDGFVVGHLFGWWLKVRTVTLLRWLCGWSSLWLVAQGSYRYFTPMALLWAISLVGGSRFVPLLYSDGFVVGHLFGWWLKVRTVTLLRWLCCGPSLWLVAQGSYRYITPMALLWAISLVGGSRFVPLHYSDGFVVGHLFGWWLKVRTVTLLRWLCCGPSLWLVAQGSYSYITPMALLWAISLVGGSRFVQLHYSDGFVVGHLFGWWLKVRTVTLLRWLCCGPSLWLVAQGSYRYITPMALLWAISLVGGSRFVPLHYSDGFVVGHLFGWWLKVRTVTLLRWLCCRSSLWLVAQGSYSYITPMALWLVISLVGGSRFVPLHYSDGFVVGHLFGWWLKVRTVTLLRWLCCGPSLWLVAQGSYRYFTPMALLWAISLVGGSRFVPLLYSDGFVVGHLFGWWLKVRTVTLLRWLCCGPSLWLVAQGSYRYITQMALLWAISLVGGSRFVQLHYSDGFVVGHLFGWWLKVRTVTLLRWLCCGPSLWLVAQGSYSYITPMALLWAISLAGGSRFVPLHYSDGFVVGHLFGWWLKVRTVTLLRWLCCGPSLWLVAQGSYSYITPMALLWAISLVGGSRFVQLHYSDGFVVGHLFGWWLKVRTVTLLRWLCCGPSLWLVAQGSYRYITPTALLWAISLVGGSRFVPLLYSFAISSFVFLTAE